MFAKKKGEVMKTFGEIIRDYHKVREEAAKALPNDKFIQGTFAATEYLKFQWDLLGEKEESEGVKQIWKVVDGINPSIETLADFKESEERG